MYKYIIYIYYIYYIIYAWKTLETGINSTSGARITMCLTIYVPKIMKISSMG